ncbi:MAG TPA: phosphate ABC transporter substrate-binding protein PstS family protein [Acidimicrobiia bacterium]|nr:phosphate ABC transporter substrate-binding protein PstS family protein [Acidimicrobiia bacterium]
MTRKRVALFLLMFSMSTVLAACGGDDKKTEAGSTGGGSEKLSGTINVSGSSTVAPITTRVAEKFKEKEGGVSINVDGPGTGDGFVLFCKGETDISDASRPIKKAEADNCKAAGIDFIELKVAIDGMAVMTHPSNGSLTCLSLADLYALIGPESKGFKKWADASALGKELGSKATYPAGNLDIYGPGEESGTYDSFVELAIEPIAKKRTEAGKIKKDQEKTTRPDYSSSGDDNIIIQGIEGSKTSLGWVGIAYANEQGDKVKKLQVSKEAGGTCVDPTDENIAAAKYPLSRYLYIYVNAAKEKSNPAIGAFVDYFLNDGIGAVTEVKYIALADADLTKTKDVWTAKTVGTRDGGK